MLRCSEWWVKEQARKRRIPYAWIGGSYLFTDEHVAEIVRLFEVRPADPVAQIPDQRGTRHSRNEEAEASVVRLHARAPRRARTSAAEAVA
jgi:hypothetical protein